MEKQEPLRIVNPAMPLEIVLGNHVLTLRLSAELSEALRPGEEELSADERLRQEHEKAEAAWQKWRRDNASPGNGTFTW